MTNRNKIYNSIEKSLNLINEESSVQFIENSFSEFKDFLIILAFNIKNKIFSSKDDIENIGKNVGHEIYSFVELHPNVKFIMNEIIKQQNKIPEIVQKQSMEINLSESYESKIKDVGFIATFVAIFLMTLSASGTEFIVLLLYFSLMGYREKEKLKQQGK